jgi:methanogenic corrinoid protein MtbC1
MGRQIIKQPDGKYCVFSSISDDFIVYDATPNEIIEMMVEDEKERITDQVNETVKSIEEGKKPYHQFTMTFKEAVREVPKNSEAKKEFKKRGWVK